MDAYPMKSVAFGGFDKQDVIRYIEQAASQAAAAQAELREENEALRVECDELRRQTASLQAQLDESAARLEQLESQLARETAVRQELEPLKPLADEAARLKAEVEALRPDADAYAQFRENIGAIECEARKRAADLESATVRQLRQTVEQFRSQYQALMSTFETASGYVTGELRKVEVNLTQLPRAMDQSGTELSELAARLERMLKGEG